MPLYGNQTSGGPGFNNIFSASLTTTANDMAGGTEISTAHLLNLKTTAVDVGLSFSAQPVLANTRFSVRIKNTDSVAHTISFPSSVSYNQTGSTTSTVLPAGKTIELTWIWTGTEYLVFNDPATAAQVWAVLRPAVIRIAANVVFDPKAVCDGTYDGIALFDVGPDCPNGFKVTSWSCKFIDGDPTTELDFDLMRADSHPTRANSAVMDVLDTTAGASAETTAANINSDAVVANGKVVYATFGTAYTEANHQVQLQVWGYAV